MSVGLLQFKQIYNFRDMGGLSSVDGRIVKRGLLYRSGELASAKEQYIKEVFTAIKLRYGNYDTFFNKQFGITQQMKERAKDFYLI